MSPLVKQAQFYQGKKPRYKDLTKTCWKVYDVFCDQLFKSLNELNAWLELHSSKIMTIFATVDERRQQKEVLLWETMGYLMTISEK